jgi:hypothetical protein
MSHRATKHHRTPKNEYENGTCATSLDNRADGYARNSREDYSVHSVQGNRSHQDKCGQEQGGQ